MRGVALGVARRFGDDAGGSTRYSTADLSARDNKDIPVVKEEETNNAGVFEEVAVEMACSLKPKSALLLPFYFTSSTCGQLMASTNFLFFSALWEQLKFR